MNKASVITTLGLCVAAATYTAHATVYVQDTFNGGSTNGWTTRALPSHTTPPNATSVSSVDVDSDGDTELRFIGGVGLAGQSDESYTTGTGGSNLLPGNYLSYVPIGSIPVTQIAFDFWANGDKGGSGNYQPNALELFFHSTYSGGSYWRFTLYTTPADGMVDGWTHYTVGTDWGYTSGSNVWYKMGGGESGSLFSNALGLVDQVGIVLTYQGLANEEYAIDNFTLVNPEPQTYAVLGFALVGLGIAFRGKLREGLDRMRK